jgi:hypothetical protein
LPRSLEVAPPSVNRRWASITLGVALATLALGAYPAAPVDIGQDLAATIALHGLPCNKVVRSQRNGDSDYVATCADGNRYHVFVDPHGRVVVQKL